MAFFAKIESPEDRIQLEIVFDYQPHPENKTVVFLGLLHIRHHGVDIGEIVHPEFAVSIVQSLAENFSPTSEDVMANSAIMEKFRASSPQYQDWIKTPIAEHLAHLQSEGDFPLNMH